jgi:hypothetical protein
MEWRQGDWELSAEVELEKLTAELLAVNVATRVSKDADADLSTPAGWELVTRLVTQPESLV